MTRRDRFTGLLASLLPLTIVVCDFVTEAYLFSTLELWLVVPVALGVLVWVMWDDKRAQMRGQRYSLCYGDCPTCWHEAESPEPGTVEFIEDDMQYVCRVCGRRWTRSGWRATGQNPSFRERELQP